MFAPNESNPMTPSIRITRQTTLDAHSRQRSNAVEKKSSGVSNLGGSKDGNKHRKTDGQDLCMASESESPEEADQDTSQVPKCMIHNTTEGRALLEEEALIDPDEELGPVAMVNVLIQILLIEGMPEVAGCVVQSVALILAKMKIDTASKALVSMMELKFDNMLAKVAEKV